MSKETLLKLNRRFKPPVHPFNLQNEGKKSYAMWQYEKGQDTIKFYLDRYTEDEMFRGKTVLDIGCGAGGCMFRTVFISWTCACSCFK